MVAGCLDLGATTVGSGVQNLPLQVAQFNVIRVNNPQPAYPRRRQIERCRRSLAASATQAPVRECLLAYAFGWAENQTQAAIKAVPLGQSAGQRILSQLTAEIPAAVDHALTLDTDDARQAFSPMLAIQSSRHEVQYSRLFRS